MRCEVYTSMERGLESYLLVHVEVHKGSLPGSESAENVARGPNSVTKTRVELSSCL